MLRTCLLEPPLPLLPPTNFLPRGGSPLLPRNPHHRRVSAQDHPPTWESPVSFPSYQCLQPLPYSFMSVIPPSYPPLLPSHLPDSCRRRTLAASKIASTVTLSWSSSTFCLHHGARSLPPHSYPVSLAHTPKTGRVDTHFATFACCLSTYVLRVYVPTSCRNASVVTCLQDPSLCRVVCLRVTCIKRLTCDPSN